MAAKQGAYHVLHLI